MTLCPVLQGGAKPDFIAQYTARFQAPAPSSQQISFPAAGQMYNASLDSAAADSMASISAQNRIRRQQVQAELGSFLACLPYGISLATCDPMDLLVYFQQVYLPQHAGSVLPSGQVVAAPKTVSTILSHLRMIFKELGRGEAWDFPSRTGNPAAAFQLEQWSQGYTKVCLSAGFRTTAAKPMTQDKVQHLLTYLSSAAQERSSRSAMDRAMLIRDGFAFCLLWQTGLRGINASECMLDDFTLPGQQRGSLKAYISSQQPMLMQHPGQIEVHPLRTKTNAENTGRVRVEPAALPILDLWFWLLALLANAISIRQPISQYMVRASKPAVTQGSPSPVFAEQQLCRSGLHNRLKKHLKQISAYQGESMHSFRRGSSQYKLASGQPKSAIKQDMLIKGSDVLELYLAAGRDDSGVKRLRTAAGQALASLPMGAAYR